MQIFIENPCDTDVKKEYENGEWKTVGKLAVPYPLPYGFIPDTMQEDVDPLDAFLITVKPSEIQRGDTLDVTVLGMAEFYEDGERDFKILVRKVSEQTDFNKEFRTPVRQFLLHAFDNNPNKKVKFSSFYGKDMANKEIERNRFFESRNSFWQLNLNVARQFFSFYSH